jgi:DEAD/DEAH box helicase domain-containing protein
LLLIYFFIAFNSNILCITTPTSSGKSLCFNIPIFESIIQSRAGTRQAASALYLFPLNALAKDQEEKLMILNSALDESHRLKIVTLSGSVSYEQRIKLFEGRVPE